MHSPDRLWWWDGASWQPAVSADGSHWFDGTGWRPRFAPQQSRSRPLMVVLLVVGLIVGGIAVMALYIRATGEAHDARSLDDARIRAAAATGCSGITQALNGAGADRQERIVAGNVAIDELVRGIEELDRSVLADDEPALDWVADWERLATEREAFGERLAGNSAARFKIPETDDGYPITQRLIDVAPPECERAVTLASQP